MKLKHVLILLLILLAASAFAKPQAGKSSPHPAAATLDNATFIDANNILMFVTNQGSFGRDLSGVFGYDYGTFWPYNGVQYINDGSQVASPLYASGLWVGGVDSASGNTLVKVAIYNSEYRHGPVVGGTFVPDADPLQTYIKTYKLYSDSLASNPSADYANWIWAARMGAPFVGQYTGSPDSATPAMVGDQMCWSVYNDFDLSKTNDAGRTAPIGLEVRQSTFAFKREGPLNNIVFVKLQAFNRGAKVIQNCYFSLWADPDLGGAADDLVGCDTTVSLGFCYNADNEDSDYGNRPPAIGYDFFQGPLMFTGDVADTGKAWGTSWPGYQNLGMASFNKYINGTDPSNFVEVYNYMNGLNIDGTPLANGTTFMYPGDPVGGTGDLDFAPADRRFMLSTGPIVFRPGDSVEILGAIIVGGGVDRKSSISVMKYYDVFAQKAYDDDFVVANPPPAPVVTAVGLNGMVSLSWTDTSERYPGDYPFEGYTVYQGVSPAGPWTVVDNFAVLNATIKDEVIDPATGQTETRVVKVAKDNPVRRFIGISEDAILGGPLRNTTTYFYKVGAYTYDPAKLPKILESSTILSVIPQGPIADEEFAVGFDDTLGYSGNPRPEHTAGVSDGLVLPIVVDPTLLNGHTYRVTFRNDISLGMVWNLFDVTAGDTVLKDQTNFSGDDTYTITDGFRLKISQNTDPFKNFEVVANGSGPLVPPEGGAADFQGFPSLQPTTAQQVGDGRWLMHTGDDGTRGSYTAFKSRTTRDGVNAPEIGIYDYEMRFTGDTGNYALRYSGFGYATDAPIPIPFELWNIGIATPTDPSDDFKMVPWILENDDDSTYNLSAYGAGNEHSVSGGDNDPYTDWIYWHHPADHTPGDAGYQIAKAEMLAGTYNDTRDPEVFARMVLVNWNGGAAPPFTQDMPEQGTIFRITTSKPIDTADVYTFVATAPVQVAQTDVALQKINTVPNPYYLYGPYDPAATNRQIKFQHLPEQCTITIYTLSGDVVRKVEKNDPNTSIATWDVNSSNGIPVASGIYIYVVDAPGFGKKVGKMAVFMEVEVIGKY